MGGATAAMSAIRGSREMKRLIAAILFVVVTPLLAGAEESWIGQKIFLKHDAKIKVDDQEADQPIDLAKLYFPLTVSDEDGDLLEVETGWVLASDALRADEALEYYNAYVMKKPDDASGWIVRGMVWIEREELDPRSTISARPFGSIPRMCLPIIIVPNSRPPNSSTTRRLPTTTKSFVSTQPRVEAYIDRGLARSAINDHDKAIDDFGQAIKLEPGNVASFYYRGRSWQAKGEHQKAIYDYDRAIELGMIESAIYYLRAIAHFDDGQFDDAVVDFDNAIELGLEDADVYARRGIAHQYNEQYAEAIWDQTLAIWFDPRDPHHFQDRAADWLAAKQYDKAIQDYTRAIEVGPKDPVGYFGRGFVWVRTEDWDRDRRLHPGHRARSQRSTGVSLSRTGVARQKRVRQGLRRL